MARAATERRYGHHTTAAQHRRAEGYAEDRGGGHGHLNGDAPPAPEFVPDADADAGAGDLRGSNARDRIDSTALSDDTLNLSDLKD